jgi:oligopeptide/dipeptide ABC transporter ATP-binding protein
MSGMSTPSELLDIRELSVVFNLGRRRPALHAVDGVDLSVASGETVGLVGESGSGKTTLGRAILGLTPVKHGTIRMEGTDITHFGPRDRRRLSAELQVVFQDPYSSFNPTRTVGQALAETLRYGGKLSRAQVTARVEAMLERVGLPGAARNRYPAQFSGGQRQRIAIARALMVSPKLVICDEPVTALDLSVQAQVLNLLRELQQELGLAYLFIAHDLAVVRHLSHRIVVLYRGRVVEEGSAANVYSSPLHPYTRALLAAAPVPDPEQQRKRRRAAALPPSGAGVGIDASSACSFAGRCPYAIDICRDLRPSLERTPSGSIVACHRWAEIAAGEPEVSARAGAAV